MKMGNFYLPPGSIEEFPRDGMKGAIPLSLQIPAQCPSVIMDIWGTKLTMLI
jgi:hypothetical protein